MASQLESAIKKQVASAFKGKLLTGTLRRETPGAGVDSFGDPSSTTVTTFTIQGSRQDFDAAYRARAGIAQTSVGILIIEGLTKPATTVKQTDQVKIRGAWYQGTRILERDPANASVLLEAHEIEDPTA